MARPRPPAGRAGLFLDPNQIAAWFHPLMFRTNIWVVIAILLVLFAVRSAVLVAAHSAPSLGSAVCVPRCHRRRMALVVRSSSMSSSLRSISSRRRRISRRLSSEVMALARRGRDHPCPFLDLFRYIECRLASHPVVSRDRIPVPEVFDKLFVALGRRAPVPMVGWR